MLAWPQMPVAPSAGLDPASVVGLHLATERGLSFGRDSIWTYGPLGFLTAPRLVSGPLFAAGVLYLLAVGFALALLLIRALRRTLWLPLAALLAWPVVAAVPAQAEVPVMVGWSLEAMRARPGSWLRRTFPVLAGAAVGGLVLVKFNLALVGAVAGATGVWATRRDGRWRPAAFAVSALGAWAVLMLALNQRAPGDYLLNAWSISTGYSVAMGIEAPGLGWQYWAALAAAVILLAGALSGTSRPGSPPRAATVTVLVLAGFLIFKEGFIRHDQGHAIIFFPSMLALGALLTWSGRRPEPLLLSLAALGGMTLATLGVGVGQLLSPRARVDLFRHSLRLVFDGGERAREIAAAEQDLRTGAPIPIAPTVGPIPPPVLSVVAKRTVAVGPAELSYAWAYHLRWRPLPVLEAYAAYTHRLDEADRGFLASGRAPARILRHVPETADDRNPQFDAPAAMIELLCRYRQVAAEGQWQALARVPDRCGRSRRLGLVSASTGQPVAVPSPPGAPGLVVVRIHGLEVSGLERVRTFFYRAHDRRVQLDGHDYRLVPGTAADGLPLRATPGVDYAGPFAVAPQSATINTEVVGGGSRRVTYEFRAVPMTTSAPRTPGPGPGG